MSEEYENDNFSPADFMRGRRPELYSDSTYSQKKNLDKELFEYHLDTLTARKQEYEFERFCTLLAKKELCPNLLPQTGPTGGGDSKVDSETYPVSDALSANWYEGVAREASKERWAFAISAKKAWQWKVRSDVEKIAGTNRGYTVVYFMTNQFVSDKNRSNMEDELSKKYSLDVRILDRTWIVDTVLKKRHEDIASDALGLSADYKRTKHVGALDADREERLKENDELVAERSQTLTKYSLCEEILKSAIIARQLEKTKNEIYARFDRAIALANEEGYVPQQIRCNYQKAWTAFWWFEDYATLNSQYDKVEALVLSTEHAEEFEYLTNLLTVTYCLKTGVDSEKFSKAREKVLFRLDELSKDDFRPNNALYCRSLIVSQRLLESMGCEEKLPSVFEEIKSILEESKILGGFPVTIIIRIVQEVGEFLPDIPVVDEVFDLAGDILLKKSSDEEAVDLLIDRAIFKVGHDKPYDALGKIEEAIQKSSSRDSRGTQVQLFMTVGRIYESVGLIWAARGAFLLAFDQLFCEFAESGYGEHLILKAFRRLLWLELKLGRTLHVLDVHTLFLNFVGKYGDPENDLYDEEHMILGAVLGFLIAKTNLEDLEPLSNILPALEEHGLDYAYQGLLYALGYEEEVLENLKEVGVVKDKEDLEHFLELWRKQPAYEELPEYPVLYRENRGEVCSRVLGTRLLISFERHDSAINFSETLLGSVEAMLARYLNEAAWPTVDEYKIEIAVDYELSSKPMYEFLEDQVGIDLRIYVPGKFDVGTLENRHEYRKVVQELIIKMLVRFVHFSSGEEGVTQLFEKTKSSIGMSNVLSDVIVTSMCSSVSNSDDWLSDSVSKDGRKLLRKTRWDCAIEPEKHASKITPGKGDLPEELRDFSSMKHTDRDVVSYIKERFWDKARWSGTGFFWSEGEDAPPAMFLLFENEEWGSRILEDWRHRLGEADVCEKLRVSIIRGINKNRPHDYRVVISTNPERALLEANRLVMFMNRIHVMTPKSSVNLERFVARYKAANSYFLTSAVVNHESGQIKPRFDLMIQKKEVNVRWAWEIPMHDPDCVGISLDDDPIVPDGEENPPVVKVLEWLRAHR